MDPFGYILVSLLQQQFLEISVDTYQLLLTIITLINMGILEQHLLLYFIIIYLDIWSWNSSPIHFKISI